LRPVGVQFPRQEVVLSAAEARQAVRELGTSVLKVVSSGIQHKSDVGGVVLDVTEETAGAAFDQIMSSTARLSGASVEGVLVQQQLEGLPVIVGTTLDDTFGPVVLVGSGGTLTEYLDDGAMALAPVDRDRASELIDCTRLSSLVGGVRGGPALSRDALVNLIVAISQLAWVQRDQLSSIELNPVLLRVDDAIAVDALIEVKRSG
jgi:succinyl-CoA synthetase beta subunit